MKTVSFRLGKLLSRLRREGIPSRAALCEAVREARRAFEAGGVPEWLILEILADAERSDVLDHPDPTGEFWLRLRRSMEKVLREVEAEPIPKCARVHGSELYWIVGDEPRALLQVLHYRSGVEYRPYHVEDAVERPADERLFVLPAEVAMDSVPLVLSLSEKVPLTGLVLTGVSLPVTDPALLVTGPATGVPVQWASFDERHGAAKEMTPELAVQLLIGDPSGSAELQAVLAPFLTGTAKAPTPLNDLHSVFRRLVRSGRLRYALEQMPVYLRDGKAWDLDALQLQIELLTRALDAMTPTERLHPEMIPPERVEEIRTASESPGDLVRWFLRDYLARRDLAARRRDGT